MNSFTDYYAILGVTADAPNTTIKTAFKKLAHQYHPDVYKGDDANERMRMLVLAYKTLNDPEARRRYDAQRTEHHIYDNGVRTSNTARSTMPKAGSSELSPRARRDRQRYYDFPIIEEGRSVHIDLIDIHYDLSADKALILRQQGLLRGVVSRSDSSTYYCHRCHHHWPTGAANSVTHPGELPRTCPKCHANDWSEYLLLRCIHCSAIFESEQIRYEIGAHTYGQQQGQAAQPALCPPYELFPLCPYCGTARWCPSEDVRVNELREQAARREALLRIVWMSVVVIAVIALGFFALSTLH